MCKLGRFQHIDNLTKAESKAESEALSSMRGPLYECQWVLQAGYRLLPCGQIRVIKQRRGLIEPAIDNSSARSKKTAQSDPDLPHAFD